MWGCLAPPLSSYTLLEFCGVGARFDCIESCADGRLSGTEYGSNGIQEPTKWPPLQNFSAWQSQATDVALPPTCVKYLLGETILFTPYFYLN